MRSGGGDPAGSDVLSVVIANESHAAAVYRSAYENVLDSDGRSLSDFKPTFEVGGVLMRLRLSASWQNDTSSEFQDWRASDSVAPEHQETGSEFDYVPIVHGILPREDHAPIVFPCCDVTDNADPRPHPTPEPNSILLSLFGLGSLAAYRGWRKRSVAAGRAFAD